MGTQPNQPAGPSFEHADTQLGDRLDSWKEIAAFLGRDVRTVQRWERQAGLPVHRHAQSRLRTAYAYRSELEAWWRMCRTTPEPGAGGANVAVRSTERFPAAKVAAGAIMVALAVGIALSLIWMRREEPAPLTYSGKNLPPIPVLIADFENQAGESKLSLLLKEQVARQLTQQQAVEVVPPARIAKLLRLMKRDGEALISKEIGRELAIRDSRVRSVVAGRVHRLNASYYVDVELIEPEEGRVLASIERRAGSEEELAALVREAADHLARRLVEGEVARAPAGARLEEVSTRSLSAVKLYSEAVRAGSRGQWGASELLARQAVAADPEFASGYAWVARAMRNQGRSADECLPPARRAVALSPASTERESSFISGTYYELAGDLAKALAAYEALLRLEPGDAQTLDLLINGYSRVGRFRAAVDHALARADAQRSDFYGNARAAHALTIWQADPRRAEPFVRRAQSLLPSSAPGERLEWKAWLRVLPVFERWLADDPAAAREFLAPLHAALDQAIGRERDALATAVGSSYLALGMLGRAERAFRSASAPVRQIDLAMLALAVGDEARARDSLRQIDAFGSARPAFFAAAGLLREAEAGVGSSFGSDYIEGIQAVTRGIIAGRRGRGRKATEWLRRGIDLLSVSGEPEYFLGVETLARLWIAGGNDERAVRLLEEAAQQRPRTYGSIWWAGAQWTRTTAQLLALYERHGRRADAEPLRIVLKRVLKHADDDHPVVQTIGER